MNRREFLRNVAIVAAGAIAADQLELLERLAPRRLFPGYGPGYVTIEKWDKLLRDSYGRPDLLIMNRETMRSFKRMIESGCPGTPFVAKLADLKLRQTYPPNGVIWKVSPRMPALRNLQCTPGLNRFTRQWRGTSWILIER